MTTPLTDMPSKVAVAMSGGVDSSAVAALLKDKGIEVIGLTMLLQESDTGADAISVAKQLGIEHHCIDLTEQFSKHVMDYFADSYLVGETPSPCVKCNRFIKFGALIDEAKSHGAQALVTGHYARRDQGADGTELHAGSDSRKDQSYFLFALTQEQIDFLRFPLADMSKEETRALAEKYQLSVAQKADSQDICFVPDGDYIKLLKKMRPDAIKSGEIVDERGTVLGSHEGIVNYTVGQRKGLNIHDRKGENNDPLFVVELDPHKNRVVVGPRESLRKTEVQLDDINWLQDDVPIEGLPVQVKLRSSMPLTNATFFKSNGRGRISLSVPQFGVSKGQAAVIYHNTHVLGGGWIIGAH